MTRSEWRQVLLGVWGNGEPLSQQQVAEIAAVEQPGETAIQTTARMAEEWSR